MACWPLHGSALHSGARAASRLVSGPLLSDGVTSRAPMRRRGAVGNLPLAGA